MYINFRYVFKRNLMLFNDVNFEIKLLKTLHLHLLKPKVVFFKFLKKRNIKMYAINRKNYIYVFSNYTYNYTF